MPFKLPNNPLYESTKGIDTSKPSGFKLPEVNIDPYASSDVAAFDIERSSDLGLIPGMDEKEYRAGKQSIPELIGKTLGKTATEIVYGGLEGAGYLLDIPGWYNSISQSENEFGNWFSDWSKEVHDKIDNTLFDIETTHEADRGFAPADATWWANNGSQIASALSILIPTTAAVKGVSALVKGLKLNKLIQSETKLNALKGITGAVFSRHIENTMEASQSFQDTYDTLIRKGVSDGEAKKLAGEAAQSVWNTNWAFLLTDIPQYMTMFRGFNAASRLGRPDFESLGKNILLEGAEEGGQFVTQEEAKRNALVKSGLISDDGTTFGDRLLGQYAKDPNLWSSVLFGGIGGGIFTAAGNYIKKKEHESILKERDAVNSTLEQYRNALFGNKEAFDKTSDDAFMSVAVSHAMNGTLHKMEEDFDMFKKSNLQEENPDQFDESYIRKLSKYSEALNKVKELYNSTQDDVNLSNELKITKFTKLVDQHLTEQRQGDINKKLDSLYTEDFHNGLSFKEVEIKKLAYERLAIKALSPEQRKVYEGLEKSLTTQIDTLKKELIEDNELHPDIKNSDDINKRIVTTNSDTQKSLETFKKANSIYLNSIKDSLDKFNTDKGKQEVEQELSNKRKESFIKNLESLVNNNEDNLIEFDRLANTVKDNQELLDIVTKAKATKEQILKDKKDKDSTDRDKEIGPISPDSEAELQYRLYANPDAFAEDLEGLNKKLDTPINVDNVGQFIDEIKNRISTNPKDKELIKEYYKSLEDSINLNDRDSSTFSTPPISNQESDVITKDLEKSNKNKFDKTNLYVQYKLFEEGGKPSPNFNLYEWVNNPNMLSPGTELILQWDNEGEFARTKVEDFKVRIITKEEKLVGYLPIIRANEKKQDIYNIRKYIWDSHNKGELGWLLTTVTNKGSGDIWNLKDQEGNPLYQSVETVFGKDYVLGIGTGNIITVTNNNEIASKVNSINASNGVVYAIAKAANSKYIPFRLFTRTLNQEEVDYIINLIVNEHNKNNWREISEKINKITFEGKGSIVGGFKNLLHITDNKVVYGKIDSEGNTKPETIKLDNITQDDIESLKSFLNTKIRQVSVKDINSKSKYSNPINGKEYISYNSFLNDEGILTSDVNPGIHTHTPFIGFSSNMTTLKAAQEETVKVEEENAEEINTIVNSAPTSTAPNIPPKEDFEIFENPNKVEEVKQEPKKGKLIVNKPNPKKSDRFKLEGKEEFTDKTKAIEWFKSNFPKVPIELLDNLYNIHQVDGVRAWGLFKNAMVYIQTNAPDRVIYHEAFHVVFNLFLSPEQRNEVLNEASKRYGIERGKGDEDLRFAISAEDYKVNYVLKAVNTLQSPKADEIFRKGDKNNWSVDKILQELQVPKEQQELIKSFNTRNREEILTSLLANYSYTIEINTAKETHRLGKSNYNIEDGYQPEEFDENGNLIYSVKYSEPQPTQHYSNLTVPGGVNYTENEIATPVITPSIKGHAQFSTDQGIGWFRSDEKIDTKTGSKTITEYRIGTTEDLIAGLIEPEEVGKDVKIVKSNDLGTTESKTRRILEVQSDLFQKGRDKEDLASSEYEKGLNELEEAFATPNKGLIPQPNKNQFLQLLNKDNNWVTFFVKSIIQDSAKKGYEKVLFPTGNTASKVEGHTTLEEFKKQKESRLKELNKAENTIIEKRDDNDMWDKPFKLIRFNTIQDSFYSKKDAEKAKNELEQHRLNEINQLKQELERVDKEGFSALKPIYKFYEENVTNILNKQYKDNVKQITDEYGNTWNEIELTEKHKEQILLKSLDKSYYEKQSKDIQLEEKLADEFESYYKTNEATKQTLSSKIANFFKKLYQLIKSKLTKSITIDELFYRIKEGQFRNKEFARDSRFNPTDPRYKVIPGLTESEQTSMITYINNRMLEWANDYADKLEEETGESLDLVDVFKRIPINQLYSDVYNEINQSYIEMDKPEGLSKLIDNFYGDEGLASKALQNLSNYGYKANKRGKIPSNQEYEDNEILDESEGYMNNWYNHYIFLDSKENTSTRMKRFIRTLPKTTGKWVDGEPDFVFDNNGIPQYVDFHETYAYIQRNLSGLRNYEEMEEKIASLADFNPDMELLYQKLVNSSDGFKAEFYSNFSKQNMKFVMVLTNERVSEDEFDEFGEPIINKTYKVVQANRGTITMQLITNWKNNFYDPLKNQTISITKEGPKIDKSKGISIYNEYRKVIDPIIKSGIVEYLDYEKVSQILSKVGIIVNPKAIETYINKSTHKGIDSFKSLSIGTNRPSIENILYNIANGKSPYEDEKSSLTILADMQALFEKDLTSDSFKNATNKSVFSYNLNSFWTKFISDLKSDSYKDVISKYKQDVYTRDNYILNKIESDESFRKEFDIYYNGGLKTQGVGESGIEYAEMTPADFQATVINMFINQGNKYAYYHLPIPADKPILPMVKMPRITDKGILIEEFIKLFNSELSRIKEVNKEVDTWDEEKLIKNYHYLKSPKDKKGNGFKFQIFKGLDFEKYANKDSITTSDIEDIKASIRSWISKEYNNRISYLEEIGLIRKEGDDYTSDLIDLKSISKFKDLTTLQSVIGNYIVNQILVNTWTAQIGIGDLAFYKNTEDQSKRTPETTAPGLDLDTNLSGSTFNLAILEDSTIDTELYKGVEETDAQGYMTLNRWISIMKGLGRYNASIDKAVNDLKEGKDISGDVFLQPVKGFYYGHRVENGKQIPTQVKYSAVPLLEVFTKNHPKLDNLRKHMEANNIDEAAFATAIKAGQSKAYVYNEEKDLKEIKPITLDNRFWKLQQEVPEHHIETENLHGTQLRKLIIANIDDKTTYEIGDTKLSGKDLKVLYHNILSANIKESFDEVVKDFENVEKVRDILYREVIDRNLGKNFEEALELQTKPDGTKELVIPPHMMKKFEQILFSIFDNRIIKQKINGGIFVQMSKFGIDDLSFVKDNKDNIIEAECYLPWWSRKSIPVDEKGNIDYNKIDPEVLKLMGYRIPTEGKYSMIPLKVKGFLPKAMGSTIVLPSEIVAQMGSDFDIDKLFTMLYNFTTEDGVYKKLNYNYEEEPNKQSKEQRDNGILDITRAVLLNSAHFSELTKPGGFQDLKKVASKLKELRGETSQDLNYILPSTQEEIRKRNQAGASLIGFAANHNVNQAISQDVKFKLSKGSIRFNNNTIDSFGATRTLDGKTLISEELAQLLAAFVDNAKDPIAFVVNLNNYTIDIGEMILRAGYRIDDMVMFLSQPIIREFINLYENGGKTVGAELNSFNSLISKYNSLIQDSDSKYKEGIYNFNVPSLENMIKIGSNLDKASEEEKQTFYKNQIKVLGTFKMYKQLAAGLAKAVKATRGDSLGVKPTMSEVQEYIDVIDQTLEDNALVNTYNVFSDKSRYPMVREFTRYGIMESLNYIGEYLPWAQPAVLNTKKDIRDNSSEYISIPSELHEDINYNLLTYIFTKHPLFSSNINKRDSLFFSTYKETPTQAVGINIYTKSKDKLGRELTNPNWGAKNIMDIEAEYKANASRIKAPNLNTEEALKYDMNLMYKLQIKKFKAHPELIQEITNRGGIKFLENSEHTIGVKGSRWEGKGINSNFIKVLIKSYQDSLPTQVEDSTKKIKQNLSLVSRINRLKIENEDFANNNFIKRLDLILAKKEGDRDSVEFKNIFKYTPEEKNGIIDGWYDLLTSDNKDIKKIGEDLLVYSLFTSGFKKTFTSFMEYAPISYFREQGILDFWYIEMQKIKSDPRYLRGFSYQYLRNSNNSKLIPRGNKDSVLDVKTINYKDSEGNITKDLPISLVVNPEVKDKKFVTLNDNGIPTYSKIIDFTYNNRTYRFELYDDYTNFAIYRITSKLGDSDGKNIEYSFNNYSLKSNINKNYYIPENQFHSPKDFAKDTEEWIKTREDEIESEINNQLNDFDIYYPDYTWMNDSQRKIFLRKITTGEISINCIF